jgi:hypothetical protein
MAAVPPVRVAQTPAQIADAWFAEKEREIEEAHSSDTFVLDDLDIDDYVDEADAAVDEVKDFMREVLKERQFASRIRCSQCNLEESIILVVDPEPPNFSYRHAEELVNLTNAPFKVISSCLPRFFAAAAEKEQKLDKEVLATMVSTLDSILDGTIIKILRKRERGPE